jgi:hypothetical protein
VEYRPCWFTVVPAFTVSVASVKEKLSIVTAVGAPSARANSTPAASTEPTTAPCTEEAMIGRNISVLVVLSLAAASRRWRDAARFAEGDIGDTAHFAQLIVRHFYWTRRRAVPAADCGKAVERAVWNVTFPSTFCIT